MLAQASKAVDEERWDQALTTLDLLLNRAERDPAAGPVKASAAVLKKKVELERHSAEAYAAFDQAAKAKEPDVALTHFDSIPAASMYKSRAAPAMAELKVQFLASHLELAEAARVQGRCDDVRGEVEKIDQVDPENRKARAMVKNCRPPPAARPVAVASTTSAPAAVRPAPRAARAPGTSRAAAAGREAMATNNVDEPTGSAEASNDPADLIRQARAAWLHQQCGQAIDLSRRALRAKANAGEAHQIIAVCACSMRDREGALKSYARLDERNRSMVRSICLKNGVELEP
jgi:tetratricopeptide (TPR) repeat protein